MAEFLIKARDAAHRDLIKDRRGCYKTGDPVVQMPDGHEWGRLECLPHFWKVRVPNLPRMIAEQYTQSEWAGLWLPFSVVDESRVVTRRAHSFTPELLPKSLRQAFLAGWLIELDFDTWKRICFSKNTNLFNTFLKRKAA